MVRLLRTYDANHRRKSQVSLKVKLNFVKVNADEEPELARNMQVEVLPTFVILKDGEVVDRKIGFLPKGDLKVLSNLNSNIIDKTI